MIYIFLFMFVLIIIAPYSAFSQEVAKSVMPMQDYVWHYFKRLVADRTFWVTGCGWLTACSLKVLILKIKTGHFYPGKFFATGGMPSSHSAFASGLTVGIGLSEGFTSSVFGLSMGLTILTAVDAIGLRKEAGFQAERINQILAEIYKERQIKPAMLKENLGHTLPEVIAGLFVGGGVAFLVSYISPL